MIKRMFLCLVIIVLAFFSILGYAYLIEPNLLRVKSFQIETKQPITPCTLVFFTDTHFGKYYDIGHIKHIVEKINQAKPDLVVFGGDLFDHYARDRDHMDLNELKEEMNKIEAKVGKYAVWGNHDYGGGAVRIYEDFMSSCGFELLDNESTVFEAYGIELIGYDDYLMGWTDPSLYHIENDLFHVILAHEPVVSQWLDPPGDNFMLSGHTHGGQVTIPLVTSKFLPEGSGQFVKGLYTQEEIGTDTSLKMYTSSGIGMTRYPFRFLNVPEIVEIKLQPAD